MRRFTLFAFWWQVKKNLKNSHFHLAFFLLSQLVWPLILVGTYYLSYTPLMDPAQPSIEAMARSGDLFSYLIPGIIVVYLYMEYVSIGLSLAADRDYGVLEPVFLSPVSRIGWLFGTTFSAWPSGFLAAGGFLASSALIFGISLPRLPLLILSVGLVVLTSAPWGAFVCAIFLSGRNMRFLYAVFETPGEFLSGARFPLASLPPVLSAPALAYPLSHAVNLLRFCWYEDWPADQFLREMLWLAGIGAVFSLMAALLFSLAEERGKRLGTLCFS